MLAIRQEARSSCVMSSASILRRRLTNVFMASLALASFDVILVVIVWGCLHDGAHTLQRELYVWLARLVKAHLLLPERQPLRSIGHQAAAVRGRSLCRSAGRSNVYNGGEWSTTSEGTNSWAAQTCTRK